MGCSLFYNSLIDGCNALRYIFLFCIKTISLPKILEFLHNQPSWCFTTTCAVGGAHLQLRTRVTHQPTLGGVAFHGDSSVAAVTEGEGFFTETAVILCFASVSLSAWGPCVSVRRAIQPERDQKIQKKYQWKHCEIVKELWWYCLKLGRGSQDLIDPKANGRDKGAQRNR